MGTFILYLASLGLFWAASMIAPLLFVPLLWFIKSISKDLIPTRVLLFFVNLIATFLLLHLTQLIWLQIGYEIGLFPVFIAIQNFIAYRSKFTTADSKTQAVGIVLGSILFLILNN